MARPTWCRSDVNRSFFLCLAACRMRSSACDTLARSCARRVLCWSAFHLVPALGSTGSAADRSALFVGFPATTTESDSSGPCIVGYDSSSSRRGPAVSSRRPNPRPPGSRAKSFRTCSGSSTTPDWVSARVIALPMLPSVILNTSASGNIKLSRLDGWPMRSPVNASPASSRIPTHDSGPVWFARPSLRGTCTLYSLPVFPAHQNSLICQYWNYVCRTNISSTVMQLLIGIGGHLAVPPLPHHRAYGSRTTAVRLG